jgi:hypothetical protein
LVLLAALIGGLDNELGRQIETATDLLRHQLVEGDGLGI